MTSAELSSTPGDTAKLAGSGEGSAISFVQVAPGLLRRLVLRKWILVLKTTWWWLAGALLLLGLAKFWMGENWLGWPLMVGVFLAWWLASAIWAWTKRPGIYEAFAYWDEQGGRAEAFANAWWIESRGLKGVGDEMHWRRQLRVLRELLAKGGDRRELPSPDLRWVAVPLLMLVGVCFLPELGRLNGVDPALSDEARKVAETEGRKLTDRELDEKKMEGLTQKEKEEVQELKNKVEETAKVLQSDGAQSAREVLAELERRAREAEQMAEKFGAANASWASEKLVAEMRKHVDTAELGDAVAAKSAEKSAVQAEALGKKMADEKMPEEVKERLVESFQQIGAAAEPEDEKRIVGQHVVAVDRHLTQSLMNEGAREMHDLADKMRTLAQRERARELLDKLAQQLRDAGSKIAGQGTQGGMQKLEDGQNQNGSQSGGQQNQGSGQGQPMMAMPNAPGSSQMPMQMPGGQNPQGQGMQGQSMQMMTPVPGDQSQKGQPMALRPAPNGSDQKGDKKDGPMLFAPIPGQPPNGKPDAMIIMQGGPSGSQGGLDAGHGTSPLKQDVGSKPTAAGQSGLVDAQRNTEGLSSVRTVEGQARQESATRGTEATILEAIAAEESALDDAALPMARREQVRRYFNELRQKFEGK